MTSLINNTKNPFLKDYSQTTLLKRNYDLIKGFNPSIKENQNPYQQLSSNSKQKFITIPSKTNPFQKSSLNALEFKHERKNNDLHVSQVRSLSQSRQYLGNSAQKGSFYRGLEEIGTKQLWKNQMQKQCRYQLKHYGPQTLRYQYHPLENYAKRNYQQQPVIINPHQNNKSKPKSYSKKQQSTKFSEKSLYDTKKTPSFNKNVVASEYYGYEESKKSSSDDDFYIQKITKQHRKPHYSFNQKSTKIKNQRSSCYEDAIPQDRNEDFQTVHNLNKLNQQQIVQKPDTNRYSYSINGQDPKRTSIEHIYTNYQHEESVYSGYGAPSQMYESGANFKTKFGLNFMNKEGPLSIKAFDDEKSQSWRNDNSSAGSNNKIHPQTLQYNNKIYYMIPL